MLVEGRPGRQRERGRRSRSAERRFSQPDGIPNATFPMLPFELSLHGQRLSPTNSLVLDVRSIDVRALFAA